MKLFTRSIDITEKIAHQKDSTYVLEFHPELWTSLFQNKNVEKSGYAVLSKSWENNKGGIFL